jgi:putative ABC transport system substrate-binding protein
MRRGVALLLTGLLLACVSWSTEAVAAEKKIALMWYGKASMPRRVMLGFRARLGEIAPNVHVTTKMNVPTRQEAEKLFSQYESEMDGIVFLRSNGAKFLAQADPKIPCFIGACNNPKLLGVIENLREPEGNITGVTYFVPYNKRFKVLMSLFPNIKKVGLVAERGHPGAIADQEGTRSECRIRGLEYHEALAGNVDELRKATEELAKKVDVIVMASNKLILDNTSTLTSATKETRTPLFAYSEAPVKRGAVAGLFARDEYLGARLAEIVTAVLVKGKPISSVPVQTDPEPGLAINASTVAYLGLELDPLFFEKSTVFQ